jgi:hypothetical protein
MLWLTEKVVQRDWNLLCFTWKTLASPRCSCNLYFWRQAYVLHLCVCLFCTCTIFSFILYRSQKLFVWFSVWTHVTQKLLGRFSSNKVSQKDKFPYCILHCVSSRYGIRQLPSNDKPVPSVCCGVVSSPCLFLFHRL